MNATQQQHTARKKVVAFWGAGVFPDDHGSKGIPVFADMLKALSTRYELILYSHLRVKKEFLSGIEVRQPPAWCGRRLGYFFLLTAFIFDHIKRRISILHAHSSHPDPLVVTLLGIIFRFRTIVGLNAGEFVYLDDIEFGDLKSRKGKINRWVVNHCDRVTAVSFFQADKIKQYMRNPGNLRVIYRGVLSERFAYQEREIGLPLKIIQVAYHHPVKDQLTLLNAFERLLREVPAHLHIVGPDFWNDTVKNEISERQLQAHVTIHGSKPHAVVSTILGDADMMVHTARYDALAVSVIEAMSCGVLCIGTRVGILSDLDGECCIAVDPGDAAALVEKIMQMVNDPLKALTLRRNARRWVTQHDLNCMVDAYVSLYEELIHGN